MKIEKYDQIGEGYNTTRKPDPYLVERMLLHLKPVAGKLYLDIGCGTGNYTIAFGQRGYRFIGVEPSARMLEKARSCISTVTWKKGRAEAIPLGNNAVDGATASLTIHHWANLVKGFAELSRVIKRGGRLVVFTSTPVQMRSYWLNYYFPEMLRKSIEQMPSLDAVISALEAVGFDTIQTEKYVVRPDLEDMFLYAGKDRPHVYLSNTIRNGISSFSALSNAEEVKSGLERLEADLHSGNWDTIAFDYDNDRGDYLFIKAYNND